MYGIKIALYKGKMREKVNIKELAAKIKNSLGIKGNRKVAFDFILSEASHKAEIGELPSNVYYATYGIAWTFQTLRISAIIENKIRALRPVEIIDLIAQIAIKTANSNEVPRVLNDMYKQ